ncbi:SDR family oxidoreductase [bacterium]|nr:SDR family oxidoreductase [bacterium]
MNILLAGSLDTIAPTLGEQLSREGHKLIIAGVGAENVIKKRRNVIVHSFPSYGDLFSDSLRSYNLDVVIFISTREEQILTGNGNHTGLQLENLRSVLEIAQKENIKKFFYISSAEVYGDVEDLSEGTTPQPNTINGHAVFAGEQFCSVIRESTGLDITILRVPFIFGEKEKNSLLVNLIKKSKHNSEVILPGSEDTIVNFLHVRDVSDFLSRVLDDSQKYHEYLVNLSSSKDITLGELAKLLKTEFPLVSYRFDDEKLILSRPLQVSTAKRIYDWTDMYVLTDEIDKIFDSVGLEKDTTGDAGNKFNYLELLKWVELVGGAVLMQALSNVTGTFIQFKYVDFRLLFVIIFGSVYGLRFGVLAFILASLSVLINWYQLDLEWELLTQNVGNWLPFVIYFTGGVVSGAMSDRKEAEITAEKAQTKLIYDKYEFLYNVFMEIRNLKDEYREQLVGYRDSFGKIFTVARELDTLQEEEVFLRAIPIFQDIMENHSVAIYSVSNGEYGRLEACSPEIFSELSHSIKLSDYPDLMADVLDGKIFQNKGLLAEYPAYVAPIKSNDKNLILIVIWEVGFEQMTMYYLNLLKILSGLTEDSLVRALKFMDLNTDQIYVSGTKIFLANPFRDLLKVKSEMQRNQIADYQILKIDCGEYSLEDVDFKLADKVRENDAIGTLEDGNCYLLLSQASEYAVQEIIDRLCLQGINSVMVDRDYITSLIGAIPPKIISLS